MPRGELDLATVDGVRDEITWLRREGFSALVLDLRQLTFIDCSGLHLVADEFAKGHVTVLVAGGPVRRAFELVGIADLLRPAPGASR